MTATTMDDYGDTPPPRTCGQDHPRGHRCGLPVGHDLHRDRAGVVRWPTPAPEVERLRDELAVAQAAIRTLVGRPLPTDNPARVVWEAEQRAELLRRQVAELTAEVERLPGSVAVARRGGCPDVDCELEDLPAESPSPIPDDTAAPDVQAWQAAAAAAIVGRLDCEDLCIDGTDWHVYAVDGPASGTDRMLLIDPPEQDITVRVSVEVIEGALS